MRVATNPRTGEVGVGQESPLAIKRATVAMEALSEEDHDVCELLHLVPYVAVGDFAETERGDALPHLEGLPDGLVGLILTHLGGVVLYAERLVILCVDMKDREIIQRQELVPPVLVFTPPQAVEATSG